MEKGEKNTDNDESLNFLDIKILLHNGTRISTNIFYKETNPHKYLNFKSAHPTHIKNTIPFNLAKRIVVFVSDPQIVEIRLNELEHWLLDCSYPRNLIKQAFHRAKLQGPAEPRRKDIIPLMTTYYPSLNYNNVLKTISALLKILKTKQRNKNLLIANHCQPSSNHLISHQYLQLQNLIQKKIPASKLPEESLYVTIDSASFADHTSNLQSHS